MLTRSTHSRRAAKTWSTWITKHGSFYRNQCYPLQNKLVLVCALCVQFAGNRLCGWFPLIRAWLNRPTSPRVQRKRRFFGNHIRILVPTILSCLLCIRRLTYKNDADWNVLLPTAIARRLCHNEILACCKCDTKSEY